MITISNFKECIKCLGFNGDIYDEQYNKYFPDFDCYLKVDFKKKELIYPIEKGFKVHGEFTCNFESNENFVVFECVNRLFEKGYKPEHLELEPKWKVGHGASGGRADILVKDHSGKSLLIIECKTEGNEFKKEWSNTLQRGGQLLTYAKQAGSTQYVCLYASDFENGKVNYFSNIISLNDNQKLLEELKDKKPLSFDDSKKLEVEDIYKAWKETYNLDFATKGIFEDDILPYQIGKQKYSIKDLEDVGSKDIQKKYHEFATILRQHNVSGRENAFDKLVNLFLCKIVDESKNPDDLKFNWKGIAYDSFFDLQDRLQLLYQAGMKEFLGEDVTYIDKSSIDKAFRFVKKDPDATRETIHRYFRQLKFFTNNDFAFIDVHNEKLFYQNSEVLLKIVRMLQDTRLQSETQNQFLGDMFEGFLDQGVKQSEGQFFTPMPIVKFILSSLPLEDIIKNNDLPPKAIDYACGAGHFLNELALQIKPFVKKHKAVDIKEYYSDIVGIEKEYRLSKVAKVSAFMYGQDDIKITYADALGKKAKLKDNSFSILISNPPYAVKGFLQTLSEEERKSFMLIDTIEEKSLENNNCIETFFVERAKQLLKPGGVAGIILPSSILSNDSSIYTETREILLKYFHIIAIAEFGSQTFGKTGTNTVTLFLKRREENPAPAEHWKNRVDSWFGSNESEKVYKDIQYIDKYCNHIEVDISNYKTLLSGNPNDDLLESEIFIDYKKAFDNQSEIKNLLRPNSAFRRKPIEVQESELRNRFIDYLRTIEKDKLYFYVLASENKHKVLVIKSPTDNKEQKNFLGYEWSSAKGNEGIKYINQSYSPSLDDNQPDMVVDDADTKEFLQKTQGLYNINTLLYDSNNHINNTKINNYIRENFLGKELAIIDNLISVISYHNLPDMLDFTRKNFNKQIQLSPKKVSVNLISKYESIKIENVLQEINSDTTKIPANEILGVGNIPVVTQEQGSIISGYTNNNNPITDLPLIVFGDHSCTFKFIDFPFVRGADGTQLLKVNTDLFLPKCFYYFVQLVEIENKDKYERHFKYLVNAKIPLPPKDIQQKIVNECNAIDKEAEKAISELDKSKSEISNLFLYSDFGAKKLNEVMIKQSDVVDPTNETGNVFYIGLENIESNSGKLVGNPLTQYSTIKSNKNVYKKGDLLYGKLRPNLNKLYLANEDGICSTDILVLRCIDEELNKFYSYYMRSKMFNDEVLKTVSGQQLPRTKWSSIETIKVPVPKDKNYIIKRIERLEQQISINQSIIDSSAEKKNQILKKYL